MKRRIFISTLVFVLALVQTGFAIAAVEPVQNQNYQVVRENDLKKLSSVPANFIAKSICGDFITVHVNPAIANTVDGELVHDIIKSNQLQNGETININNIGYVQKNATAKGGPGYKTTFSYGSVRESLDKFVTSVARGAEKRLSKAWSYTISGELEGAATVYDITTVTAKLGGSVTCRYSTTYIFRGPLGSSKYNSREFRVKYYRQKVTVTQVNEVFPSIKSTFKYDKAVKYADYSIDKKV